MKKLIVVRGILTVAISLVYSSVGYMQPSALGLAKESISHPPVIARHSEGSARFGSGQTPDVSNSNTSPGNSAFGHSHHEYKHPDDGIVSATPLPPVPTPPPRICSQSYPEVCNPIDPQPDPIIIDEPPIGCFQSFCKPKPDPTPIEPSQPPAACTNSYPQHCFYGPPTLSSQ